MKTGKAFNVPACAAIAANLHCVAGIVGAATPDQKKWARVRRQGAQSLFHGRSRPRNKIPSDRPATALSGTQCFAIRCFRPAPIAIAAFSDGGSAGHAGDHETGDIDDPHETATRNLGAGRGRRKGIVPAQ
jgi:hypothetical protein